LQAQKILKEVKLPNSYTLTKHMCEELLAELHCREFPVAIMRPTIIGAIARFPVPGYFGNAAGLTSATLAFATGARRHSCLLSNHIMDCLKPPGAESSSTVSLPLLWCGFCKRYSAAI
jgi:hypothetical protein